jgi:hypothetical protein
VVTMRGKSFTILALLVVLASMGGAATVALAQNQPSQWQVKAAFILNFAQFIDWPEGTFADRDSPIVVGVLGDDPFEGALEQTFADASAQSRRLVVQHGRVADDMRNCNILFISPNERDRQSEILASLKDVNVVTISETPDFARRGGVINFYIDHSKVRFEINPTAAERKRLKISSQLLKRAKIVE